MGISETLAKYKHLAEQKSLGILTKEELEASFAIQREKEEKDRLAYLEQRKHAQISKLFNLAGIPTLYRNAKLIPVTHEQTEIYKKMSAFCRKFKSHYANQGRKITIHGAFGTGKTYLASAIANELMGQGFSVIYMTLREVLFQMQSAWKNSSSKSEQDILKDFLKPDLIIIDEVGLLDSFGNVLPSRDFEESRISAIYDLFYREKKTVINITNLSTEQLEIFLTPRIYQRITQEDIGAVFELKGDSLRKQKFSNSFMDDLDDDNENEIVIEEKKPSTPEVAKKWAEFAKESLKRIPDIENTEPSAEEIAQQQALKAQRDKELQDALAEVEVRYAKTNAALAASKNQHLEVLEN
jgi:DNA replication protein DnaC